MASTLGASSSHTISFFLRYILYPPQLLEGSIHTQEYGSKLAAKTLVLLGFCFGFFRELFSISHCLLCYKTIAINAHIVHAPCGPLIGELINL
jgi:hypothetical protein